MDMDSIGCCLCVRELGSQISCVGVVHVGKDLSESRRGDLDPTLLLPKSELG